MHPCVTEALNSRGGDCCLGSGSAPGCLACWRGWPCLWGRFEGPACDVVDCVCEGSGSGSSPSPDCTVFFRPDSLAMIRQMARRQRRGCSAKRKLCGQRACMSEGKTARPKRILSVGSARGREVRPPGVSSCLHIPHEHRGLADQEEQSRMLRREWRAPRPREQPPRTLGDLTCENPSL